MRNIKSGRSSMSVSTRCGRRSTRGTHPSRCVPQDLNDLTDGFWRLNASRSGEERAQLITVTLVRESRSQYDRVLRPRSSAWRVGTRQRQSIDVRSPGVRRGKRFTSIFNPSGTWRHRATGWFKQFRCCSTCRPSVASGGTERLRLKKRTRRPARRDGPLRSGKTATGNRLSFEAITAVFENHLPVPSPSNLATTFQSPNG